MALRISQVAYRHTTDLDLTKTFKSKEWDRVGNVCVVRATNALTKDIAGYTKEQRDHLGDMFNAMSATNRSIRRLLEPGFEDPSTVDALALARLQLECLYALCLMFEDAQYVDHYTQDYWKKQYVSYLLAREEVMALPRLLDFVSNTPVELIQLGLHFGVTMAQIATVELQELGKPLPPGVSHQAIPKFPTPGGVIPLIPQGDKRRMLERLHQKYVELCSFAHGLGRSNLLRIIFDSRSPHNKFASDADKEQKFQYEVTGECYTMSFLSIAQATAELTLRYPGEVDLSVAASDAWDQLRQVSFVPKAVWELRTRALLGIIG